MKMMQWLDCAFICTLTQVMYIRRARPVDFNSSYVYKNGKTQKPGVPPKMKMANDSTSEIGLIFLDKRRPLCHTFLCPFSFLDRQSSGSKARSMNQCTEKERKS
uniref:Uncharacterized protein n=1 Tax=Opuntia streptacantha TaxID=393608 RepID=A0A7C9EG90_OPUST